MRQPVQKRVGRGVARLARAAEDARHGREQHEQIEIQVTGGAVQMPRAEHLRRQNALQTIPALVRQHPVRQHPRRVDHAGQRRQLGVDTRQQCVNRATVRDVRTLDRDRHAALAQRRDRRLRLGAGCAAPVEHDRPGAPIRKPGRDLAPEPTETTGHEIGPVTPQAARGWIVRRRAPHQTCRVAHPGAMRDLGLAIRMQKLADQGIDVLPIVGVGVGVGVGVEIHQPHSELRRLEPHRTGEPPERRAGKHATAFAGQTLRSSGHEPDAGRRCRIGIQKALGQCQRTRASPHRIPEQLAGRSLVLAAPVKAREMDDAAQRVVLCEPPDERAPRFAAARLDLRHRHPRQLVSVQPRGIFAGNHHPLIARRQCLGQPPAGFPAVRCDHPPARGRVDLRGPARHAHIR